MLNLWVMTLCITCIPLLRCMSRYQSLEVTTHANNTKCWIRSWRWEFLWRSFVWQHLLAKTQKYIGILSWHLQKNIHQLKEIETTDSCLRRSVQRCSLLKIRYYVRWHCDVIIDHLKKYMSLIAFTCKKRVIDDWFRQKGIEGEIIFNCLKGLLLKSVDVTCVIWRHTIIRVTLTIPLVKCSLLIFPFFGQNKMNFSYCSNSQTIINDRHFPSKFSASKCWTSS